MDGATSIDYAENAQPVLVKTEGATVVQIHMPGDDSYKSEIEQVYNSSYNNGITFEAAAADLGYEIGTFSVF